MSDTSTILKLEASGCAWDAFVAQQPEATFCHLAGWREVMTEALGHECQYVAVVDGEGNWRGALPLVRVRSPIFGRFLVSMPFLNYGGPVGTPVAQDRLSRFAVGEARRFGSQLLELRNRAAVTSDLDVSDRKITVTLPLPSTVPALWEKFPSKLRSQVRKASKSGLETRFGLDQLDSFYSVFARNMRDLGTPVMPRAWFETIARVFPAMVQFGTVYHGATPVAAGCGFLWRGEYEMTWASSLREFNSLAPNMLLYASFMERMIGLGAHTFNFGRCTAGGGTHRFKKQWGGIDVPLPWTQWPPTQVHSTPNPDRGAFKVAVAVWQRLPLPLTNRVGPFLARVIP